MRVGLWLDIEALSAEVTWIRRLKTCAASLLEPGTTFATRDLQRGRFICGTASHWARKSKLMKVLDVSFWMEFQKIQDKKLPLIV